MVPTLSYRNHCAFGGALGGGSVNPLSADTYLLNIPHLHIYHISLLQVNVDAVVMNHVQVDTRTLDFIFPLTSFIFLTKIRSTIPNQMGPSRISLLRRVKSYFFLRNVINCYLNSAFGNYIPFVKLDLVKW